MNLLTILREHIAKHQYERGAHKGTAPADHTRRGRTHERLIDNGDHVSLRFHYTDIIKVFEDRIVLDTSGYHSSPTTRTALSDFMGRFMHRRYPIYYITSDRKVNGPCITRVARNGERTTFAYYDHMAFDIVSGEPVTPLRTFTKKVADREARKEWRDNPQVKTWRSLLPVLVSGLATKLEEGTLKAQFMHRRYPIYYKRRMLIDDSDLVLAAINSAYGEVYNATRRYDYATRTWVTKPVTAAMVWAYINRNATSHMTKLIDTGATTL